jgi:hypothetical protein
MAYIVYRHRVKPFPLTSVTPPVLGYIIYAVGTVSLNKPRNKPPHKGDRKCTYKPLQINGTKEIPQFEEYVGKGGREKGTDLPKPVSHI